MPTWHYEAVEIEGLARQLSEEELVALRRSAFRHDGSQRYSPEQPWTRAKMESGKFEAMTKAIVGFEVEPTEIRGTRKFNQHKSRRGPGGDHRRAARALGATTSLPQSRS